jgi:NDP-sugar pyrophosphorylase family protein
MKAVILIGGKGTRLRPITYTTPKSMVPMRNKPYIQYLVDSLRAAGLDGAVLSMGYLPYPIQQYFAEQDLGNFSLDYVVEEHPLGTAGGIKNVEEHLEEGPFVATNGDVLTGLDLMEVVEAHRGSGALATITLTSVEDPTAYGLVEVDYQLRVQRFVEKPGSDEVTPMMAADASLVVCASIDSSNCHSRARYRWHDGSSANGLEPSEPFRPRVVILEVMVIDATSITRCAVRRWSAIAAR